jgi:hypothetical protein
MGRSPPAYIKARWIPYVTTITAQAITAPAIWLACRQRGSKYDFFKVAILKFDVLSTVDISSFHSNLTITP